MNRIEALSIVALIKAMVDQPAYDGLTVGVVSLLGNEQALTIEKYLAQYIPISQIQERRILCGSASQFQGDERDVILISPVDSGGTGPLSLKQSDDYKKILNVATSRAKDQMWIVHSLNPDTDLKSGDFRLRLLRHAENPQGLRDANAQQAQLVDSEFERRVLAHLSQAGYRCRCQVAVGAFRIDIVVFDDSGI